MTEVSKIPTNPMVESFRTQMEATAKTVKAKAESLRVAPSASESIAVPASASDTPVLRARIEPLTTPRQDFYKADAAQDGAIEKAPPVQEQVQAKPKVDPVAEQEARKAVSEANRVLAERLTGADSRLIIEPDPRSGRFIYKSVDKDGNVRSQWPREEFLRMVNYMRDVDSGAFIDKKV